MMTVLSCAAWWAIGFVLAITARQAIEYGSYIGLRFSSPQPITNRTLIGCFLLAFGGPVMALPVFIAVMFYLVSVFTNRNNDWLNRPVFKRRNRQF